MVEHLADRVAVMYLGRFVEERTRAGLFAGPQHPYSRALLESVLTPDPDLGVPDTHLGAVFPNPLTPTPGCAFHPRCPSARDLCQRISPVAQPLADGYAACHFATPAALPSAA